MCDGGVDHRQVTPCSISLPERTSAAVRCASAACSFASCAAASATPCLKRRALTAPPPPRQRRNMPRHRRARPDVPDLGLRAPRHVSRRLRSRPRRDDAGRVQARARGLRAQSPASNGPAGRRLRVIPAWLIAHFAGSGAAHGGLARAPSGDAEGDPARSNARTSRGDVEHRLLDSARRERVGFGGPLPDLQRQLAPYAWGVALQPVDPQWRARHRRRRPSPRSDRPSARTSARRAFPSIETSTLPVRTTASCSVASASITAAANTSCDDGTPWPRTSPSQLVRAGLPSLLHR